MYKLLLELEDVEGIPSIQDALAHVSELVEGGFSSGPLGNESIGFGHWELTGICSENICDGSGEVSDPEGGTKPCPGCKSNESELDGLDREDLNNSKS